MSTGLLHFNLSPSDIATKKWPQWFLSKSYFGQRYIKHSIHYYLMKMCLINLRNSWHVCIIIIVRSRCSTWKYLASQCSWNVNIIQKTLQFNEYIKINTLFYTFFISLVQIVGAKSEFYFASIHQWHVKILAKPSLGAHQ